VDGEPTCIAVGADGTMYAGVDGHVDVLDRSGRRIASWPSLGENAYITAIAAGPAGVWVADSSAREILRYTQDGKIASRFGKKDAATGYPGLIVPSPHLDVALAPDGRLFCSNPGMHRVETHDANGALVSSWGEPTSTLDGFCGCCNPTDFALFPDGRFVTAEKGIPRVKIYSKEGKFLSVVAAPDAFPSTTMGLDLAVSQDNRHVFVLDLKARTVRVFSPKEGNAA
jgi:sugar lactone lactonase YvrE